MTNIDVSQPAGRSGVYVRGGCDDRSLQGWERTSGRLYVHFRSWSHDCLRQARRLLAL